VSAEDEASLRAEGGIERIRLLPNVTVPRARSRGKRDPVILFVGGFQHSPNRDAATWLVKNILPRVRQAVPAVTLRIVGHAPPPEVLALGARTGVDVIGFVPDVGPHLDAAAVSVAPLRYGAGMKGKVTEAMAAGIPVVTTSWGAQGLRAQAGKHLLLADSATDFAGAVIRCLREPTWAANIGLAGQRHIEGVCGEAVVADAVDDLVRQRSPVVPSHAPLRLGAYRTVRRVVKAVRLRR
jgi:glycosyltransferase involved in cell wall biosynthesis